jgi:moderate conductance mechanosensitive channel
VLLVRTARITVILLGAWLVTAFAGRLVRRLHRAVERRKQGDDLRRINTVNAMLRNVGMVVVIVVAGMLVLSELGVSVAPLLATAGVAGLAIGFGAQSLIKDYFNGFFLLIEDQLREGDVVEIGGKAGEVEEMTLRYVRLRDGDGYVYFIPNGEIKMVVNRTRAYAFTMIDAAIAGQQDIDAAFAAMREVGEAMRKDPGFAPVILNDLEVFGVERWELWGMVLRCRFKVLPYARDNVRREFLRRLAAAFEAKGVKSP